MAEDRKSAGPAPDVMVVGEKDLRQVAILWKFRAGECDGGSGSLGGQEVRKE
jgi:hypothetical protein